VLGAALESDPGFDAIHVGAAAEELPDVLVQKLNPLGRMVIPVGSHWGHQVCEGKISASVWLSLIAQGVRDAARG
jgi:protein-L-isoaspartate O-methyltransferase